MKTITKGIGEICSAKTEWTLNGKSLEVKLNICIRICSQFEDLDIKKTNPVEKKKNNPKSLN